MSETEVTLAGDDIVTRFADPKDLVTLGLRRMAQELAKSGAGLDSLAALTQGSTLLGIDSVSIDESAHSVQFVRVTFQFQPRGKSAD